MGKRNLEKKWISSCRRHHRLGLWNSIQKLQISMKFTRKAQKLWRLENLSILQISRRCWKFYTVVAIPHIIFPLSVNYVYTCPTCSNIFSLWAQTRPGPASKRLEQKSDWFKLKINIIIIKLRFHLFHI